MSSRSTRTAAVVGVVLAVGLVGGIALAVGRSISSDDRAGRRAPAISSPRTAEVVTTEVQITGPPPPKHGTHRTRPG